MHGHMNIKINP